ncbi:family 16 glycosylhydrolase (plasmid) [Streptomyces clavuligerus]|nr:1,3-beta-glucanase [Streptomyces clavuligerus]EDY52285.1 endo-1,3-beta-glucanase [Streptomyces clavuligerus]MBY6306901.1 family 16 glycosylhydrolase [Streptomyces clavuligerus]QCS10505.1 1,3-beta-glucanase [Streptomyces clavuligerus]QPJ98446.1 family 16 glycosylhydrolase [Streptomyces clavuligerus]
MLLAALALGFSLCAPQPLATATAPPPPGAGAAAAVPVFEETFDGPAGAAPDARRWNTEVGDNVNNRERQYYTPGNANAALDGQGHLVITARRENPGNYSCWYGRCEYTSARLNTAGKFNAAYGRVEARVKMSRGQGVWPAFWMLGQDFGQVGWPASGEIDIMENVGHELGRVHGTLHGPGYSGGEGITGSYNLPPGQVFADAFHTFAIDWAPDVITWSVDGQVYQRRTPADLGGRAWVFNKPFFLLLNLAIGGNWPGDPDGSTVFPQRLVIDHVRVTASPGTPGPGRTGVLTGLAGKCLDIAGANPADRTPVQLYTCNGTVAQRWTLGDDGTVRALGKCLDAQGGQTADGTRVQLYTCNGTGAQRWAYNSAARDLVNVPANKCLDVLGQNPADATPTQLWTCSGNPNQKWNLVV